MYDAHRDALGEADDSCTLATDVISGRPVRYIKNKLVEDLVASGLKPLPIPAQLTFTFPLGGGAIVTLPCCCPASLPRWRETPAQPNWSSGAPKRRRGGCAPSLLKSRWLL